MEALSVGALSALVGLTAGIMLGLAARLGDFCTLGALEMAAYGGDQRRLRLWGIVLGTSIIGTFAAEALGLAAPTQTIYHTIAWSPTASVLGGLLFGYGMALAGNCGFGALVRCGGGDLRSLIVVVVIGISAFVTLSGPLSGIRVAVFPQTDSAGPQGFAHALSDATHVPPLVFALIVGSAAILWTVSHAPTRRDIRKMIWGGVAGLSVVWSLVGTTLLADASLGEIGVEGPSFTAPLGRTIIYFMTSSAGGLGFSVGIVAGVLLGAFLGSMARGLFRWEACEDPRELGRQISGAALMGVGGTLALGCSVGQGVTGMATLAYSAPVTLAAIAAGGLFGLRQLIRGFQPE